MPERETLAVEQALRLDQMLVQAWPDLGRAEVRRMIQEGSVLVNGQPARKPGQRLVPGDRVESPLPVAAPEGLSAAPGEVPVAEAADFGWYIPEVLYEDEALVVVEKPAGMAVHAGRRPAAVTLVQLLRESYPESFHVGGAEHGGVVVRLEPEISGPVLIARTEGVYRLLQRAARHQRLELVYQALVEGDLGGSGTIEAPIGNVGRSRTQLAVTRQGRPAVTAYRALCHYRLERQEYALLEVRPQSARMHQLRVHLAWHGYPIVGDRLYGSARQPLLENRLFLHLQTLAFPHPVSGEPVRIASPLSPELQDVLRFLTKPKR